MILAQKTRSKTPQYEENATSLLLLKIEGGHLSAISAAPTEKPEPPF